MTSLPFYQVDAFADAPFTGNPAAVMPLETWLPDATMQAIAAENNLSETAFLVATPDGPADFGLRWFTPTVEVALCGHATMASAHIVMTGDTVRFSTLSGILTVNRDGDSFALDLPAPRLEEGHLPGLAAALGVPADAPQTLCIGGNGNVLVELADEAAVRAVAPDFAALKAYDRLVVVTARGDTSDVVSRAFAAYHGIDEDPVTGSAHAALTPYWSAKLGRDRFTAYQASARGGRIDCRLSGDRAILSGRCRTVIEGRFFL